MGFDERLKIILSFALNTISFAIKRYHIILFLHPFYFFIGLYVIFFIVNLILV